MPPPTGWCGSWQHDLATLAGTALLPAAILPLAEWAKAAGLLSTLAARKLIHTAVGLVFVATWPLYSPAPCARWVAASLVAALTLRFVAAGLGLTRDAALVASTARTGRREELLRGPLLYGAAIVALTLAAWRDSPAGPAGVAALCAGDGLADVAGRAWGRRRLPHNRDKTWAGSLACFGGSLAATLAFLLWFRALGLTAAGASLLRVAVGSVASAAAAAAVESLPGQRDWDNLTVPAAAGAVAWWLVRAG